MDATDTQVTAFNPTAVTVDVAAFTVRDSELCVLLVRRGTEPFAGQWALPGSFLRTEDDGAGETLDQAAARTLGAKTGLDRVHVEQLGSYGAPDRDPRMRVISVAYLAFAPDLADPTAAPVDQDAAWVPVSALALPDDPSEAQGQTEYVLAFDHSSIVVDALDRARAKLEYTPLATAFVPIEFTIPQLRQVYEAVWGQALHGPNFRRKVLGTPGFVSALDARSEHGSSRGGPRAQLYTAGSVVLLHPALLRAPAEVSP